MTKNIELNRTHTELIRSVICKTAGSRLPSDVIDELTSDTCLALLEEDGSRSLGSYDAQRGMALNTFIGMVAKSVTLDHFRQRKRRDNKTSSLDATAEEGGVSEAVLVSHGEDALGMLIRREQRQQLEAAIKTLSADDQAFLQASLTGDDAFVKKLARQNGVTEVAIRVRKSRVAERLRSVVKSNG